MSKSGRVVITGMGWVTPLGADVESVWTKLLAGESAVAPVTRYDASTFATNFAAEVKSFELPAFMADAAKEHESAGLGTKFALAAAAQAWVRAGLGDETGQLGVPGVNLDRMGVYLGAGEGSLDLHNYTRVHSGSWQGNAIDVPTWARLAKEHMSAIAEVEQEPQMTLAHVASAFGCGGPSYNCMTACAAGAQAVGEAFEIIRRGDASLMFAGGSHSMIHPLGMTGFIRLTAMSTRRDDPETASRPFDATRDGFVMGEGAGMLVLEDLDHALARGANILAEVAGYGSTADAYRITDIHPDGNGGAGAMKLALKQAGIDPTKLGDDGRPPVHYINAHGTGTKENDKTETAAVKQVFGEHAGKVPFGSIKSMMGHLIQAAGTVELICCIQAIRTGMLPPTRNLTTPDAACDLDHIPGEARDLRESGGVRAAMSNSFGFGGQNDSVCITAFER